MREGFASIFFLGSRFFLGKKAESETGGVEDGVDMAMVVGGEFFFIFHESLLR